MTSAPAKLSSGWLVLARSAVVALTAGLFVLFVLGVPHRYRALTTLCTPVETCPAIRLGELEYDALPGWLGIGAYATYNIVVEVVILGVALVVAALVFLRLSHTRMGLLAVVVIMTIGIPGAVIPALAENVPLVAVIFWPLVPVGFLMVWLFILIFPDGRIKPPWVRRHLLWILLGLAGAFVGGFFVGPVGLVWLLATAFPLAVQAIRYRRYATAEQRQQVKWALVGTALSVLSIILWMVTMEPAISPVPGGAPRLTWNLVGQALISSFTILFPIALAFSILRYRLWDVDRLINRALVYGSLTLTLTGIYVGTIVLVQQVVLGGQNSPLVVAGSTLLIAALFAPLRRRIQTFIDRRFYRSKYDSQQALAAFAAAARAQVDLDALTAELLRVVGDTVQPQQVGVWLKSDAKRPRQSGTSPSGTAS